MGISISRLDSGALATGSTTIVTASVSPTANSLLVIAVIGVVTVSPGTAPPTSVSGIATWTEEQSAVVNGTVSPHVNKAILDTWTAQCGSSPGSSAITATYDTSQNPRLWALLQVTGHRTSSPVVQSPTVSQISTPGTSAAISMAALVNSSSAVLAFFGHSNGNATTPDGAFSELTDNAAGSYSLESEYAIGDNTPSASWTTTAAYGGVALEIAALTTRHRPPGVFHQNPGVV